MNKNFNKDSIIYCEKLTKIYKNKSQKIKAIDGISFRLNKGEIVGFLGPNGAGKTTTIKCLCRLINPTEGRIFIDGVDVVKKANFAYDKICAVLEGNRSIYWRMSTKENLNLFAGLMGYTQREVKHRIEELVEIFGLKEKIDAEARFLSRGMQQKLSIACALIKNTDILLLDEPTLGLDVETTHEVKDLLKREIGQKGRTILLSSHNMQVVEDVCDRVVIINNGKIIADEEIKRLKEFFQVNSYRFEIASKVNEELTREFSQRFLGTKFLTEGTNTLIDVNLKYPMEIYEVLEIFKARNLRLLGIQNIEPDFEEIYLKLVKNEK